MNIHRKTVHQRPAALTLVHRTLPSNLIPSNSLDSPPIPRSRPHPGCLFDVVADPTEHNDLAAAEPELLNSLLAELDEQATTIWNRQMPPEDPACMAAAATVWGGFLGPYEELDGRCGGITI